MLPYSDRSAAPVKSPQNNGPEAAAVSWEYLCMEGLFFQQKALMPYKGCL